MGKLIRFFLRSFEDEAREQAMAFERARAAAFAEPTRSADDIIAALAGNDPVPLFELPDGRPLLVDRKVLAGHQLALGMTGSGKSFFLAFRYLLEILDAIQRLLALPEKDDERLPLELRVIDVKSETVGLLKLGIAALYVRSSARIRRAIARSVHIIEWRRDAITPMPLLSPSSDLPAEYEAELKTDILVRTSRQEWPESVRFLFTQFFRICKAINEQPHPIVFREVFRTDAGRDAAIKATTAPDLRDFLANGLKSIRPQTIEAAERRIAIEFSYPAVFLSSFVPYGELVRRAVPIDAPIMLADCGSVDLPPSIGMARANLIVTDVIFAAMRRSPVVPLRILIEEALALLAHSPQLLARLLDALRLLRSTNTAVSFAAQSLEALPKAAMREIVTNLTAIIAFQARADAAEILAPHVPAPSGVSPRRARELFERELASLKTREAYLWVKTAGGVLRVRSRELADPVKSAGMPADALRDLFDREITPRSRISVADARASIEAWEQARTAGRRPTATTPRPTNVRSFLGLDGDDDV